MQIVLKLLLSIFFIALFQIINMCATFYIFYKIELWNDYSSFSFLSFYAEIFNLEYELNFTLTFLGLSALSIIFMLFVLFRGNNISGNYGNAKFATKKDIKKWGLYANTMGGEGITIGKLKNFYIKMKEPLAMLVVAPPGTGKTTSFAIPNLLTSTNSFFTLDVKGELYETSAHIRENKHSSKVYIFDPYSDKSSKFNPFDKTLLEPMSWGDIYELINNIAGIIYEHKGGDPHWSNNAKQVFVIFAIYFIATKGHTSLTEIKRGVTQDFAQLLKDIYKSKGSYNSLDLDDKDSLLKVWLKEIAKLDFKDLDEAIKIELQNKLRGLANKPDNEFGSIISSFSTPLEVLGHPQIAKTFDKNDFDILKFRQETSDLYIKVNEAQINTISPLIRIFLDYNIKKLMSTLPSKSDKTITLMLDEFPRFGRLEYLVELPALSRAYKIPPIYICQSLNQIKEIYKEKSETILSTTALKVVFPQGDDATAKRFSDMMGKKTIIKKSSSSDNIPLSFKKNISISKEGVPLVPPQEILSLDTNTIYLLYINHYQNPIKCNPNKWFENKELTRIIKKYKGYINGNI